MKYLKKKSKSLVRVASKRGDPIEFRPHAQHRLQSLDDSFDLRYSAYLWNQALIDGVYQRCFERAASAFSKSILELLASPLHRTAPRVQIINVPTGPSLSLISMVKVS